MAYGTPALGREMNLESPFPTNQKEFSTKGNLDGGFIFSSTPASFSRSSQEDSQHSLSKIKSPKAKIKRPHVLNLSMIVDGNEQTPSCVNFDPVKANCTLDHITPNNLDKYFYKNGSLGSGFEDISLVGNRSDTEETTLSGVQNDDSEIMFTSCRKLDLSLSEAFKHNDSAASYMASHDSGIGSQDSITPSFKSNTVPETESDVNHFTEMLTPSSVDNLSSSSLDVVTTEIESVARKVLNTINVSSSSGLKYFEEEMQMDESSGSTTSISTYFHSPVQDNLCSEEDIGMDVDVSEVTVPGKVYPTYSPFPHSTASLEKQTCVPVGVFLDSYGGFTSGHSTLEDTGIFSSFENAATTSYREHDSRQTDHIFGEISRRREKVDFLLYFGVERTCPEIVEQVFSYLEPRDLTSVAVVSKSWNRILQEDKVAYRRAQRYLEARQKNKENCAENVVCIIIIIKYAAY